MKFSILTPCFNAEKFIGKTIESVILQKGDFEIEYIIIDGKSSDKTIQIIDDYKKKLASKKIDIKCNKVNMSYISEKDSGMYEALSKGFSKISGDIVAYINADDFYQDLAFETVKNIMDKYNDIKWITGMQVLYNSKNQIIDASLPCRYKRNLIKKGYYGYFLPFIQQESTFWKKEMLDSVDFKQLSNCKLAGDFYLWKCFATKYDLNMVQCILSGFRRLKDQKSTNKKNYYSEMFSLSDFKDPISFIQAILEIVPNFFILNRMKKYVNKNMVYFDTNNDEWNRKIDLI